LLRLPRHHTIAAIDQRHGLDYLHTGRGQCVKRLKEGSAGGNRVVEHRRLIAGPDRANQATTDSVALGLLANRKGP